ncbi:hypothetical protein GCM10010140_46030 [Streptosporangium pseudovulgare]|uniref:Uncharacterized protein n=1 Tax=Streptosporangium pseudovulgare TaxID=35765 RepID=A0ABQ2R6R1_9ACTN|nr:hypothetical protein GCM10010140_46030 [Streptosporangium pseudovulgare]
MAVPLVHGTAARARVRPRALAARQARVLAAKPPEKPVARLAFRYGLVQVMPVGAAEPLPSAVKPNVTDPSPATVPL